MGGKLTLGLASGNNPCGFEEGSAHIDDGDTVFVARRGLKYSADDHRHSSEFVVGKRSINHPFRSLVPKVTRALKLRRALAFRAVDFTTMGSFRQQRTDHH